MRTNRLKLNSKKVLSVQGRVQTYISTSVLKANNGDTTSIAGEVITHLKIITTYFKNLRNVDPMWHMEKISALLYIWQTKDHPWRESAELQLK